MIGGSRGCDVTFPLQGLFHHPLMCVYGVSVCFNGLSFILPLLSPSLPLVTAVQLSMDGWIDVCIQLMDG